mgnify:CR=1 FL=1
MSETFAVPDSLSPSSTSTFQTCPLQFRFQNIQKLPQPPGAAAVKGNVVVDPPLASLDTIESNLILNEEIDLDRCVDNIRRTHGAVSFGKFSPIFLSNNNWYLE